MTLALLSNLCNYKMIAFIFVTLLFALSSFGQNHDIEYIEAIRKTLKSSLPSLGVDKVWLIMPEEIPDNYVERIKSIIHELPVPVLISYVIEGSNVSYFRKIVDPTEKSIYLLLPSDKGFPIKSLMESETQSESIWLLPNTFQNINVSRQANIPINSHVYLGQVLKKTNGFVLSEIYQVAQGTPYIENNLGTDKHILARSERTIWSRRHNLQGLKWNVVLKVDPPYLYRNTSDNSLNGYNQDVWSMLEKNLNITSNLIEVNGYGKLIDDDKWDGLLGDIQDGKADISMTPISYTYARSQVVDFLMPLGDHHFNLGINVKHKLTGSQLNVIETDAQIIFIALVVVSLVMSLILFWFNKSWKSDWGEVCLVAFGTYVSQGIESEHVKALPQKVLFYTHFLCSIMVLSIFSARLTSNLAVKGVGEDVKNLHDVHSKGLNLYISGGGNTESEFALATSGIKKKIWEDQMSKDRVRFLPQSRSELFANFDSDPKGVILTHTDLLVHRMNMEKEAACNMVLSRKPVKTMPFAIPVRKDFPYTKLLNYQIEKMRESGILNQFNRRHLNHDAEAQAHLCSSLESEEHPSIALSNVKAFFMLIAFGIIAGVALLLLEKYFKCFQQMRQRAG